MVSGTNIVVPPFRKPFQPGNGFSPTLCVFNAGMQHKAENGDFTRDIIMLKSNDGWKLTMRSRHDEEPLYLGRKDDHDKIPLKLLRVEG